MPKFREWAESVLGIDVNDANSVAESQREMSIDPPVENALFL